MQQKTTDSTATGAVDVLSIGRAVVTNVKEMSLIEGGSTITQQLAKNLFFTQEKDFSRKIAEIFMGYNLEKNYSKEEILELYVNTSYFGSGYYGIREASLGYYNKEPKDLNFLECTMLAGLPNAPSAYALNKYPERAQQRQKQVINKMVKHGYLTKGEAEKLWN